MTPPLAIDDMIARYPGTNRQSWAQLRYRGTGPKYFKVGRKVFYRPEDIEEWETSQTRTITPGITRHQITDHTTEEDE